MNAAEQAEPVRCEFCDLCCPGQNKFADIISVCTKCDHAPEEANGRTVFHFSCSSFKTKQRPLKGGE